MKKLTSVNLILVMVITILGTNTVTPITAQATTTIKIGDYVQMGKYYDEPILWRCVDIDENGPLMLADKILAIKPFDAVGNHKYLDGTAQADNSKSYRTKQGSSLWETSNIRSWLNSTATAGNVMWLDGCPPTADRLWRGSNAYANEKGFLADGNFTESERNAMKSVMQKSLLNYIDVSKLKVGGTAPHTWDFYISKVVQNYDTAYYQNVTDKMFLLDVKQINKVYQNSSILGTNYYIGKPTQKAVDNSDYKDSNLSTEKNWNYWLRTPCVDSDYPCSVRYVDRDGVVYGYDNCAFNSDLGVRAAFNINMASITFKAGNGSMETPFIVSGEELSTETPMPTATSTPIPTATLTPTPSDQSGDFTYQLIDNGANISITGYTGLSGYISLPSTYDGKNVTNIADKAFYRCTGLISVTIPKSITSIGNEAFYGCNGLTSLAIPNSVVSIGNETFLDCNGLTSLAIPNSVISIGNNVFTGCAGLTQINVDDNNLIFSSQDGVLFDKTGTAIIEYPEGKTGSYIIKDGMTSIGAYIFARCTGLTSITIPNSVTSIGDSAFAHCTGLASITIPNSVTNIGDGAFRYCEGLTSVIIPNSMTSISSHMFYRCPLLTNVTIPSSVTSIGDGAFYECYALTNVIIPDGVTNIGATAFLRCRALTSITIPNGVTSIGDGTFYGCTGLTSMNIPSGVTSIGDSAFRFCTGLTSITISNFVTSIGEEVFTDCSNLTIYGGKGSQAQYYAKQNNIPFVVKNLPTPVPTPIPVPTLTPVPTPTPVPMPTPVPTPTPIATPIPSGATILTLGCVNGLPNSNVNISVNITANSGMAAGTFILNYDTTKLDIIGNPLKGAALSSGTTSVNANAVNGTITVAFAADGGIFVGGSILDLTFKIKSTAKGTIPLTLSVDELIDDNFDNITCGITQGAINAIMIGDVTGDGQVTTVDSLKILNAVSGKVALTDSEKIAADVTKNGKLLSTNALKILKYCSGKITEL